MSGYTPNPVLQTYRRLVLELVDTVNAAFTDANGQRITYPGLAAIRQTWRPVPATLAAIDDALAQLGQQLLAITTDQDLTGDARARRITAASDEAWATIRGYCTDVSQRADEILTKLRAAVYPTRPTPADAAQEARLAGIKADARMSLDPLDGQGVVNRIEELLARALRSGDELTAWLFASSDWPSDYLVARRLDDYLPSLRGGVDDAVTTPSPDTADLVRIYRTLADPRDGLPVLDVLLNNVVSSLFEDLRSWRPTSASPLPPTQIDVYGGASDDVRAAAAAAARSSGYVSGNLDPRSSIVY